MSLLEDIVNRFDRTAEENKLKEQAEKDRQLWLANIVRSVVREYEQEIMSVVEPRGMGLNFIKGAHDVVYFKEGKHTSLSVIHCHTDHRCGLMVCATRFGSYGMSSEKIEVVIKDYTSEKTIRKIAENAIRFCVKDALKRAR